MNCRKRRMVAALAGLVLGLSALTLAACGPKVESQVQTPTATPQAKYGGTLQFPILKALGGYDTHRTPSYGPLLGYPVFSRLVYFDPNKRALGSQNLLPDLAERWETSADGRSLTFYLSRNAKWHDGTPFTADDVVYTLEKLVDPKRSSISGYFPAYDRAVKVDDYTVKVSLKYASPSFLVQLAGPFPTIQAKHLANVDWKTTGFLVGTGPFKFKGYVSGVSYELVKNPDYFKKGLPYLDGIIMHVIEDVSAHGDAVVTKRVDMAMPVMGVSTQAVKERIEAQVKDVVWDSYTNPYGMAYFFNQGREPLKDIRVRKALAMLMDRPALATAAFGSADWADYDHALFAPPYGLPKGEIYRLLGWDKTWEQRVAEAKRLIAEAGYAKGFKMRITVQNAKPLQSEVTLLADTYRRNLNLDVQLDFQLFDKVKEMRSKQDFDLLFDDVLSYVGDPDEITGLFTSGSAINFLGYRNPELDKLISEQSKELDVNARIKLVQKVETLLLTDLPIVPGEFKKLWHSKWPYVKGFQLQDVGYGSRLALEQVWLDK